MNSIIANTVVYAGNASSTISGFLDGDTTGIGPVVAKLMGFLGVLIVIFAIIKAIKDVIGGKVGNAVKAVLGGVVLAALLIAPAATIGTMIDTAGNIISKISGTVDKSTNTPASNGGQG